MSLDWAENIWKRLCELLKQKSLPQDALFRVSDVSGLYEIYKTQHRAIGQLGKDVGMLQENSAALRTELEQTKRERDRLATLFMQQMIALMSAQKNPCKECIVRRWCIEEGRCCSDWARKWARGGSDER